jgi:hypothetical protein
LSLLVVLGLLDKPARDDYKDDTVSKIPAGVVDGMIKFPTKK